jgi:DNA-binding transcriptional LysR family regulator
LTPAEFIAKWRPVELEERSAAQTHFNDLCRLLGLDDPVAADPTGTWFTFEKGATKATGGEGWADVWWRPFLREPLFLVAPPGSPQLGAEEFLVRYPYVRFRSNVPLAHMIDLELARLDMPLNEVAEIDTVSAIMSCVANGLGVSVVPQVAIDHCGAALVAAPFGSLQLFRQIGLVERQNGPRAMLIDELHRRLLAASGEHAADLSAVGGG